MQLLALRYIIPQSRADRSYVPIHNGADVFSIPAYVHTRTLTPFKPVLGSTFCIMTYYSKRRACLKYHCQIDGPCALFHLGRYGN